jgi:hypothetical protein
MLAGGRYHAGGWVVDLRGGSRGPEGRLASVHEAWHDRLQFTTLYGLLVQALWEIGDAADDPASTARGDALMLGATRTQEEFAAWSTELVAGDALAPLRDAYPLYAAFADRAAARLADVPGDYLRLHAANAVYRSVMQPAGLVRLVPNVAAAAPSDIGRAARPDHRLAVLTTALAREGWPGALLRPDLAVRTVQDYVDEDSDGWQDGHDAFYRHAALLLRRNGCPTLDDDGQLAHLRDLASAAERAAGRPLRLRPGPPAAPGRPDDPAADADAVLRAVETERIVISDDPARRRLPPGTDPDVLASGRPGPERHLFLAIRPARRTPGAATASTGHSAVLRGTRLTDDGEHLVVELDVTDNPAAVLAAQTPVITSVGLSCLADDDARSRWAPALASPGCTVLMDLPPTRHLASWLADGTLAGTWAVATYLGFGAEATVVVWRLRHASGGDADATSRLHIAVTGPTYPTALSVWLSRRPALAARFVRDDAFADRDAALLNATVGHLLAEETTFDFRAEQSP